MGRDFRTAHRGMWRLSKYQVLCHNRRLPRETHVSQPPESSIRIREVTRKQERDPQHEHET